MHGSFDPSPQDDQSIYRNWNIKLIAVPVLLSDRADRICRQPSRHLKWISEAVQASSSTPIWCRICSAKQLAQPSNQFTLFWRTDASASRNQIGAAFDREFDVNQSARMVHIDCDISKVRSLPLSEASNLMKAVRTARARSLRRVRRAAGTWCRSPAARRAHQLLLTAAHSSALR